MFVDITEALKLNVAMCRNMDICGAFRVVAAKEKYPGFTLLEAMSHTLLKVLQPPGWDCVTVYR